MNPLEMKQIAYPPVRSVILTVSNHASWASDDTKIVLTLLSISGCETSTGTVLIFCFNFLSSSHYDFGFGEPTVISKPTPFYLTTILYLFLAPIILILLFL